MVEAIDLNTVEVLMDPAVGEGALLKRAARRWPTAEILAADIDEPRVAALSVACPGWTVSVCDFLQSGAPQQLARQALDARSRAVLLNPPFSVRGGTRWQAPLTGTSTVMCGRAMAFFLGAVELLGRAGQLVALLPSGVLTSERDADARRWLDDRGALEEVMRPCRRSFKGAVSDTVIVRFTPGRARRGIQTSAAAASSCMPAWTVTRGTRQMHTVDRAPGPKTVRLVHTTDLRNGRVASTTARIRPTRADRVVHGPVLLLPRVGRPDPRKVVLHSRGPVALSDCVFAVAPVNGGSCAALRDHLLENFDELRSLYGGTGAPYMRRESLQGLLAALNGDAAPGTG